MILRLLLVLFLSALTGCSAGFFHLTGATHPVGQASDAQTIAPKDKQARLKVLSAVIKAQQKILDRYEKQASAKKQDPLTFVTDVEFAEAQARLAKAQAESDGLRS